MTRELPLVVLVLALAMSAVRGQFCNNDGTRADCRQDSQQACQAAGCCWNPALDHEPYCFFSNSPHQTYVVVNQTTSGATTTAYLKAASPSGLFGPDITWLLLEATAETDDRLRVRIVDATSPRYEIPSSVIPLQPPQSSVSSPALRFVLYESPFGFAVVRGSTTLFNTSTDPTIGFQANGLIFEQLYLELSTQLPANASLYGLGEHVQHLRLDNSGQQSITMWNVDNATPPNQNLYGSHPFYMELRSDGSAHGVYLHNSNGMQILPFPGGLTYHVIGGVLDFFFFAGPTPESVTQQYHQLIGLPALPPYWSLGMHQCRWGYPNLQTLEEVVHNYSLASIPLDTMWSDINYMDAYKDFTWDPVNYPPADMTSFALQLNASNQHYVVIVDPGIMITSDYAPFSLGTDMDVWIKRADGDPFTGWVWPGEVYFPDFLSANGTEYWIKCLSSFLSDVLISGLWIDMNEPSNFCSGECLSPPPTGAEQSLAPQIVAPIDGGTNISNPPFWIVNYGALNPLQMRTVDVTCTQGNGRFLHYDVHSLYGLTESISTRAALLSIYPGKRPFVLTRSTFVSSGAHVAHWLGDNQATFGSMYASIPGQLAMNMFGVPMVGADMCGFNGDTTEELCARWMALGSFSTFTRNHNTPPPTIAQEPYRWPTVAQVSRLTLGAKYSLLPYYHSLLAAASVTGGTVLRPLFFEFPTDATCNWIDTQFLVGPALMVSPVLTEGATTVTAYFPNAVWYDFWTYAPTGFTGWQTLPAPLTTINVHLRGGYIVPMQANNQMTTHATRQTPMNVTVALDAAGNAVGSLFWDDGESIDTSSNITVAFAASPGSFSAKSVVYNNFRTSLTWGTVSVLGVASGPSTLSVNGASAAFDYSAATNVLAFSVAHVSLSSSIAASWH